MAEQRPNDQRLGALSGGLTGLALAAGIWGPDAVGLWQARVPFLYPSVLIGAAVVLVLGVVAGWLAARASRIVVSAIIWLAAAVLAVFAAGHLPFEGRSLMIWLTDRRFWGLPIYPFDAAAQTRMVFANFFPAVALMILGLLQEYRLETINGSLEARRLSARSWFLLLLPLPLVFGAGLGADGLINRPLRGPLVMVAQVIVGARDYTGDLDVLSQQTNLNYNAIRNVRASLVGPFRLMLGDNNLSDDQTVIVVAHFDSGAWINCRVLPAQVLLCSDASPPYTQGLQGLLAGQEISECQDCAVQLTPEWQAVLHSLGRLTGTPHITRLAQWGSYVLMRAANPASGYAVECMFQGNSTVTLLNCRAGS